MGHPFKGRFITLEGVEGVGKSTHVTRLVKSLEQSGYKVLQLREPGGTPEGEELRNLVLQGDETKWDVMSEAFIMCAARRQNLLKNILPALEAGTWVVCDRFMDSTTAYQGYVKGLALNKIETLHQLTLGDFRPDLTLILDVDDSVTLARIAKRQGKGDLDRIERTYEKIHKVLRGAFLDIASREPARCFIIDASVDKDSVAQRIINTVNAQLAVQLTAMAA
jgi:dTMP kinase